MVKNGVTIETATSPSETYVVHTSNDSIYLGKEIDVDSTGAIDVGCLNAFMYEYAISNYGPALDAYLDTDSDCSGYGGCSYCPDNGQCL